MLIYVNTYCGFLSRPNCGLAPSCLGPLYALILDVVLLTIEKRKGAHAPILSDDRLPSQCAADCLSFAISSLM